MSPLTTSFLNEIGSRRLDKGFPSNRITFEVENREKCPRKLSIHDGQKGDQAPEVGGSLIRGIPYL